MGLIIFMDNEKIALEIFYGNTFFALAAIFFGAIMSIIR